jgi:hypothetical protein
MALQTSGAISLLDIQNEFGGSNPISLSEYYGAASGIPASGTISIGNFYGATAFNPLSWTTNNNDYWGMNLNMDNYGLTVSPFMKVFNGYNDVYLTTKQVDFYITPGVAVNYWLFPEYTGYPQDRYSVYADGVLIEETTGDNPGFQTGADTVNPIYCSVLSVRIFNGSGAVPYFNQSSITYQMFTVSNVNFTQGPRFLSCSPQQGAVYQVASGNQYQDSTVSSSDLTFVIPSKFRIDGSTSSEGFDIARWYINGALVSTTSGEESYFIDRTNVTSAGFTYTKDGSYHSLSDSTYAVLYFRGAA